MTDKQENKLSMYDAVKNYCTTNLAIIASMVALQNAYDLFTELLTGIHELAVASGTVTTGYAAAKKVSKQNMCKLVLGIARSGFAYASATGNSVLKAKFDYSLSDLQRLRDEVVDATCRGIWNEANGISALLADYGVTTAVLTSADAAILSYADIKQSPRNAISDKKTMNTMMETLFETIDPVLKERMDPLVKTFEFTNSGFVTGYFNARIIVDRGRGASENKTPEPPTP